MKLSWLKMYLRAAQTRSEMNGPLRLFVKEMFNTISMCGSTTMFLICSVTLTIHAPCLAQEKQLFQIKTFDQKLQVFKNVEVSINGKDFISVGNNGTAFIELNSDELPINTIKIRDDQLEPASWNFTKGVVEIIVRKKTYKTVTLMLKYTDGMPVPRWPLTFYGRKTIAVVTDANGKFEIPIALNDDNVTRGQFVVNDHSIAKLTLSTAENILFINRPRKVKVQEPATVVSNPVKTQFNDFDLDQLDSIQSLTAFYSVFKNISIQSLDEDARNRIDAKFNQLITRMEDSAGSQNDFIGSISDSSIVAEDIKSLLNQATIEKDVLQTNRSAFDDKLKLITRKLEKGTENLSESEHKILLSDLDLLEKLLIQNENNFFKNQDDYHIIINTLRERFFDVQNLEKKLSESESKRLAEERLFQKRLLIAAGILVVFASLIILLITLAKKLHTQSRLLLEANEKIKTINENLEVVVFDRTRKLQRSNKELDTFLYRASHDLRSPLRSILGLCNISRHISTAELVEKVGTATLGMDKLLQKLITISEINQSEHKSGVVLKDVINSMERQFQAEFKASSVKFLADCPQDIVLKTYPTIIDVILSNLIENAFFYSAIKNPEHAQVELKVTSKDGYVELSVRDNGAGISEPIRSRIFDMFFKGSELSKGNGLGLFVVHKCVQFLKGKIRVETKLDRYSKFIIQIPQSS